MKCVSCSNLQKFTFMVVCCSKEKLNDINDSVNMIDDECKNAIYHFWIFIKKSKKQTQSMCLDDAWNMYMIVFYYLSSAFI